MKEHTIAILDSQTGELTVKVVQRLDDEELEDVVNEQKEYDNHSDWMEIKSLNIKCMVTRNV